MADAAGLPRERSKVKAKPEAPPGLKPRPTFGKAYLSAAMHRKQYGDNAKLPMSSIEDLLAEGVAYADIDKINGKTYDEVNNSTPKT